MPLAKGTFASAIVTEGLLVPLQNDDPTYHLLAHRRPGFKFRSSEFRQGDLQAVGLAVTRDFIAKDHRVEPPSTGKGPLCQWHAAFLGKIRGFFPASRKPDLLEPSKGPKFAYSSGFTSF